MDRFDLAIVGGGIAGASAAYELSPSLSVLLIEAEAHCGYHATGRSAALFSETYGPPVVCALSRASRAFLERPPEGFTSVELLTPSGSLHVGTEADRPGLAAVFGHAQALGVEVRWMDEDAIRALIPIMKRGRSELGVFEPGAMNIDVDALLQGYLRGARARGATIATGERLSAVERLAGVWRLKLGDREVEAATLVNAAGAWADEVAVMAGLQPLGVQPMRRTAAVVAMPAGLDMAGWPLVIAADENFYFKPDAGLLLVSPADETPSNPCDAWADDMDVATGIDRAMDVADLDVRRVVRSWAGLRSFAPDRCPVVGRDPRDPGFVWLAGQGGYGVQTAPAIARLLRDIVVQGGTGEFGADILAAVSPARFVHPQQLSGSTPRTMQNLPG